MQDDFQAFQDYMGEVIQSIGQGHQWTLLFSSQGMINSFSPITEITPKEHFNKDNFIMQVSSHDSKVIFTQLKDFQSTSQDSGEIAWKAITVGNEPIVLSFIKMKGNQQ